MTSTAPTIKFNVGGTHYEVSKSLLENFKGSMLERSASKVWNEGGDEVFIEGNGNRFQYVLDFMRHGKVTLPNNESGDAFFTEMEYYGISCDEEQVYESEKVSVTNIISEILHSMNTATFANLIAIDIIQQGLMNNAWVNRSERSYKVKYKVKYSESQSAGKRIDDDKKINMNIIKDALETHTTTFIIEQVNPIIERVGLKISGLSRAGYVRTFTISFKVVPLL